jgi:hypothetical protein
VSSKWERWLGHTCHLANGIEYVKGCWVCEMKPKQLLMLACFCLLTLAGTAREKIIFVPPHCVEVTRFDKPCVHAKRQKDATVDPEDISCPLVHIRIKPLPECSEFNQAAIFQVPK